MNTRIGDFPLPLHLQKVKIFRWESDIWNRFVLRRKKWENDQFRTPIFFFSPSDDLAGGGTLAHMRKRQWWPAAWWWRWNWIPVRITVNSFRLVFRRDIVKHDSVRRRLHFHFCGQISHFGVDDLPFGEKHVFLPLSAAKSSKSLQRAPNRAKWLWWYFDDFSGRVVTNFLPHFLPFRNQTECERKFSNCLFCHKKRWDL